jgi:hypothetical protein
LEYIVDTGYVGSDAQTIKQALVDKGPLAVSMGIGDSYGGYWSGDIYRCTNDSGTNHAVIIVGYNDAGGYWLVRNSWGTSWGDSGYFKLGYGECSIEEYVYYADAQALSVGPLEHYSHTIDDDTTGGSSGNGDGVVDCGEIIELPLDIYNQGSDTATGVEALLSTSDSYIYITDSQENYPDIPGGGTGTCTYDFDFEVASNTPDGHIIHFDLDISASNGGPWTDSFDIPVTCATDGEVVVNEVDLGGFDAIEISNPGTSAVNMTGWVFSAVSSGSVTSYTFPSFTLGAGSYVVVHETSGTDTQTDLYMGSNINWVNESEGAASLVDTGGQGVDFVRWGSSTDLPPSGTGWSGTNPASPPAGYNLGRDALSTDTDDGSDWCTQDATLGAQNGSCITNYPPYTPGNPTPSDGATGIATSTDLSWTGGDPDTGDTVTYDVYFGTSNPPTTLLCNDTSSTTCDPGTLSYDTPYYWYVVATDNHGAATTGSTWDFTTAPAACSDPHEPNDTWAQATSISYGTTLSDPEICPAGDVDYYAFSGSAGDTISVDIDAQAIGSSLDSYLHLYDTDGVTQLTYNDDDGGLDSYLEYTLPADGTYYLKVRDYSHPNEGGLDYFYNITLNTVGDVGPLVYQSHTIDDDTTGQSVGDGDGIVDCGEAIELYVDLYNQGSSTALTVTSVLTTTDPYVSAFLFNGDSDYPNIVGGGTGRNNDDWDFEVAPGTPDGHVIQFDLDVTAANGGPWTESFDIPVTCGGGGQASWTFLVYLDGDNNLESAGIDDFLEMSSVGSTSDVNIVVQFDRISGYDTTYGDWTDTRRFHITQGETPWDYNGVSIGEANMGDPQTLIDFVQWGMSHYPADRYAVVLWDHGSGWRYEEEPLFKGVAFDDTDGGDGLTSPELRSAMDTLSNHGADPLDLVGFDACLMGMIEVDNQLIPYVDVRVGSEETEPEDGWPFDIILSELRGTPSMSASQLGTVIVDEYYASYGNYETQSAVDLHTAYDTLNTAVNDFAVALINGMNDHFTEIAGARANAQAFYVSSFIDLYDFAYQINQSVSDSTLNGAATDVMNAVDNAVIREQHGSDWPGAHGISIYFPESSGSYDATYDGSQGWLQFTMNTQWDEWLNAFYAGGGTCNDPHEPNNSWGEATSISYGTTLSDPDICPAGDVDYYAFTGSAGDTIVADIDAQTIGSSLDAYLFLYDTDGVTPLTYNDDSDGLDSYIAYEIPADGTYYLMVGDYSHPDEGGANYFYTLSLSQVSSPFDVNAGWTSMAPTVDGQIATGEWAEANTYDITPPESAALTLLRGSSQDLLRLPDDLFQKKQERQTATEQETIQSVVTLYAMTDGTHLYLAIDNPNDTSVNTIDQMGVYFDDNPLPSDGQWTNTTCGNAEGEGNFWVITDTVEYREITAGPTFCNKVTPAPGTSGSISHNSGHAQAEIAIDLTASALRASPGDTLEMYLWIYDADTSTINGVWPITAVYNDPATYHSLTLQSSVCNDPHEPNDTWAQATSISYGTTVSDPDICSVGDVDYYAFTGNGGDTIVADINAQTLGSSLNPHLTLYGTNGIAELTYNDDDDGLDSRLEYTLPADGTYYLKVRDYDHPNEGGPDYFYTLTLSSYGFRIYLPTVIRDRS